jgi:hypothetical protein
MHPCQGVAGDFYGFPQVLLNSLGIIPANVMGTVWQLPYRVHGQGAVINAAERGQSPAKIFFDTRP